MPFIIEHIDYIWGICMASLTLRGIPLACGIFVLQFTTIYYNKAYIQSLLFTCDWFVFLFLLNKMVKLVNLVYGLIA